LWQIIDELITIPCSKVDGESPVIITIQKPNIKNFELQLSESINDLFIFDNFENLIYQNNYYD
jgi:hypothetical protein